MGVPTLRTIIFFTNIPKKEKRLLKAVIVSANLHLNLV